MQKLHFSIFINAPREKVWNTMLDDATYRIWTTPFCPGSFYEGSWEQGSEIKFFGPDETGKVTDGMYSKIAENRLHEFVSIAHLGMIKNGEVVTTGEEIEKWVGAHENYTFVDKDGGTEVSVDLDITDEYKDAFTEMWNKALVILKELAEK
ncbi:MAG: SRPBCC domain-containing protein [Patescibacteria group bacterium]